MYWEKLEVFQFVSFFCFNWNKLVWQKDFKHLKHSNFLPFHFFGTITKDCELGLAVILGGVKLQKCLWRKALCFYASVRLRKSYVSFNVRTAWYFISFLHRETTSITTWNHESLSSSSKGTLTEDMKEHNIQYIFLIWNWAMIILKMSTKSFLYFVLFSSKTSLPIKKIFVTLIYALLRSG